MTSSSMQLVNACKEDPSLIFTYIKEEKYREVAEALIKKSKFSPNIKNNSNQTVLDIALNNNHLCMAFKILEDKRFTNINMFSFKNLFNVTVRNKLYGKYSKITNLEIIIDSLNKKDLDTDLENLIDYIKNNMDSIKQSILNNRFSILDSIINEELVNI